ncbi:hypothetical protein EV174_001611 [Coemansia sp. RSA 2320]|nr:hypothetical protein EV174_001611 [Coemansia sp. RSA 2320]
MLFASSFVRPKTQVEIRIIQASAFIRSTNSNWFDQLQDKTKCQEWTTDIKRAFNLADKDVEYVLEELKYYALLKENAVSGEELSGVDRVWINDRVDDEAFKLCAAILEEDYAKTWWGSAAEQYLPAGSHKLSFWSLIPTIPMPTKNMN